MAVICKNCGGPHPFWECTRTPSKSTAARPPVDTPKRGRPKTITDMKAYKAEKARAHRTRQKEK